MRKILESLRNLKKRKCLAFVLSGGGARGAFQAGALQALQEAGLQPDLLVGTSIGAVNAAYLAIHGFSADGIQALKEVWRDAAQSDLLPTNYMWLTVRGLFRREVANPTHRLRDFFINHGIQPEMRFADLQHMRLVTVSADLNAGRTVSHGLNPDELILEAVLASAALPPWVTPIHQDEHYLIDGGFLSSLPVEPAMAAGATEIVAIDLSYRVDPASLGQGFGTFLEKLVVASELRQGEMEIALARARKIPLTHIRMKWPSFLAPWDFQHTEELMELGYQITTEKLRSNLA